MTPGDLAGLFVNALPHARPAAFFAGRARRGREEV
jgi:hypothetical protein